MRGLKSAVAGGIAGALCATATVAIAGSGVGGVFNLGQGNSADATSSLTGTTNGTQLNVWNLATTAAARALVVYGKSPSTPAAVVQNAGGGPALGLWVNAGRPPFTVSSSTKVASLNADQLDGLDSSAFQPHYSRTRVVHPVGTSAQNGTALKNALAGITTATSTDPWLLKIEPGTYDVGSVPLTLKANVDVEGSGQGVTTITGAGGCVGDESRTVEAAVAVAMRELTVANSGGCNYASAIRGDLNALRLRAVTASASGGTIESRGIVLATTHHARLLDVNAEANGGSGTLAYALKIVNAADVTLELVRAYAHGAPTGGNVALRHEGAEVHMLFSHLATPGDSDPVITMNTGQAWVAWSQVDGGPPSLYLSTLKCAADYNGNLDPVTC